MRLNTLNFHSKLGLSGFLISIILGLFSAATLIGLLYSSSDRGFNIPEMDKVKAKYSESALVGSMKTTMYQYVTVDGDIKVMEKWVQAGALENDYFKDEVMYIIEADCQKCHSRSSTMTGAIPSIPFNNYADISVFTEKGYSWTAMAKTAHIHLFGIALLVVSLTFILSFSCYPGGIKSLLISTAWLSLWIDMSSWWLAKFSTYFAYFIAIFGTIEIITLGIIAFLCLIDLWFKVPDKLRDKKE
jgi:hypothetical protein